MIPPTTAQYCFSGCCTTATVSASAQSTQCVPAGNPCVSDVSTSSLSAYLGTNLKVDAGPMILAAVLLRPMVGEKGAIWEELIRGEWLLEVTEGTFSRTEIRKMACSRRGSWRGLLKLQECVGDLRVEV